MRQRLTALYHFLGGIHFALALMTIVATAVIVGTFLESATGSHRYASQLTYGHPLFRLLILCLFVNILFSALRRWPFQSKHLPFLITHLGMLMILSGMMAKSFFGLQGSLTLIEGSGSHFVNLPERIGLQLESRDGNRWEWELTHALLGGPALRPLGAEPTDLAVALTAYTPHAQTRLEQWTKGDYAFIQGLPPLPLVAWTPTQPLPHATVPLPPWHLQAFTTRQPLELIHRAYLEGLWLRIRDTQHQQLLCELPLAEALAAPVDFLGGQATLRLDFSSPALIVDLIFATQKRPEQMRIALSGAQALNNQNMTSPGLGSLPIELSLQRQPTLTLIRDEVSGEEHWLAFHPQGEISEEIFATDQVEAVYVLDGGFEGYATQYCLSSACPDVMARRVARLSQLQAALAGASLCEGLSPPLQRLAQACEAIHADFSAVCLDLLDTWDRAHSWLLTADSPLSPTAAQALAALDWASVPTDEQQGSLLAATISATLEAAWKRGDDLARLLATSGWPLPLAADAGSNPSMLMDALHRQAFMAGTQLPATALATLPAPAPTALFSAYLRAYGLHLSQLPDMASAETTQPPLYLQTRVTARQIPLSPLRELEKNRPGIRVNLRSAVANETIDLSYEANDTGLKWPVLNGRYLARFQPLLQAIPYHIRLRDARKVNYPNSNQPFSYEADVIVTDLRTAQSIETTLSMNRVHETTDGYRFYLASIAPSDETAVRRVQLAVNRDPAKYFLTYLGAAIMTLGIVLLFTLRPYH